MPKPINPEILQAAIAGLEAQKQQVEQQIAAVRQMLGKKTQTTAYLDTSVTSESTAPPRKKRVLSDAARKAIALAQKKRWANFKKAKASKKN